MADIQNLLPNESTTVSKIYAVYKKAGDAEQTRGYLGASIIGHSCERALWYGFRACCKSEFIGRIYRLFDTGNWEEKRFVKDLRNIGCTVHDTDSDGKQFAVEEFGGHFSGHLDGCVLGVPEAPKTWHVLEFKTHNAKSFVKLKKEGVEKTKPQHFAQMQVYMGLTGMTRALYLAVNKDTDELYSERIRFNEGFYGNLLEKARRIITATTPPDRIASRPDYYECSYCDAKGICWGSPDSALPIPAINCRQCCHATPITDGIAAWTCEKHHRGLSLNDQSKACDDHLILPGLISFAEPVDASSDWIDFRNYEGCGVKSSWRHGKEGRDYSTAELMKLPASELTNSMLVKAKEVMGAVVTNCCDNILSRYPEEECRIVWYGPLKELISVWGAAYGRENIEMLTPITKVDDPEFNAAEFSGGRVAIVWKKKQFGVLMAEIREGKE